MKHEKLIVSLLFMILAFQSPGVAAGVESFADWCCLVISVWYLLAFTIEGIRDARGGHDA